MCAPLNTTWPLTASSLSGSPPGIFSVMLSQLAFTSSPHAISRQPAFSTWTTRRTCPHGLPAVHSTFTCGSLVFPPARNTHWQGGVAAWQPVGIGGGVEHSIPAGGAATGWVQWTAGGGGGGTA